MTDRKRLTGVVLVGVFLLIAAACGQKPGVAEQTTGIAAAGGGLPAGTAVVEGQVIDTATGEVLGTAEEFGLEDTSTADTGAGTTTTTTGTTGGTGGGGAGGSGTTTTSGGPAPSGGDATGVTKDVIKIGIHAPLTGAAPVPSDSVEKGKDLFWRYSARHNIKVLPGDRTVEVILKNDNYNPSQAVAVCKEMVEKDKVFLLSGAAGTDQIQACARYAASVGVPYVSAGVTEKVVDSLPNYLATSMTYPDQGPLLVDFMVTSLGAKGEKNGMLRFDTPNFQDAHDAFMAAADNAGMDVIYDRAVSKGAGAAEANTVVQEMQTKGLENVYVLTSPTWWIQVLQQATRQAFLPQWVGVGITNTFDTVALAACEQANAASNSVDGSKFFSPFPAWNDYDKFDPDFKKAVRELHPEENGGDDFMGLSWLGSLTINDLLALPGENLTRERFMHYALRAKNLENGVGPELNFAPDDHFGANQVHLSQANCASRPKPWTTIKSFVSDF